MLDLPHRLTGLAMTLASGGSTLLHRSVYDAAKAGPPVPMELVLGLTTFILTSTGILLLIHGSRLFERRRIEPRPIPPASVRDLAGGADLDTREGVARRLALRAIAAAADRAGPGGQQDAATSARVRDAA